VKTDFIKLFIGKKDLYLIDNLQALVKIHHPEINHRFNKFFIL
jgi:hypothetical protein